ncbi:hypothetical protein MBANPS3_007593 [Mucor bainieri]
MPRPLSDSWQYFELLSPDNGRSRKAKCSFCGHEQAAGITRLHQHLLYRCSRISSEIRDQLRQKQDDRGHDTPVPPRNDLLHSQPSSTVNYHFDPTLQNTLDPSPTSALNTHSNYFDAALSPTTSTTFSTANPLSFAPNTDGLNQQQPQQQQHQHQHPQQQPDRSQAMLDWHLARALFSANIPFDKIENSHMIEFFKRLQPNYVVPKARRLQQFLLKEQHWDLIQAQQMPSPPTPTPPLHATSQQQQQQQQHQSILQQRQNNVGRLGLPPDGNTVSINNNTSNNASLGSRLLASIHPPAELEGSL